MGGDHAPSETVKGVFEAAREGSHHYFVLVGESDAIQAEMARYNGVPNVEFAPASQVVSMAEEASRALRVKPDSSISVGMRLVKSGEADAFISAGNTGAVMGAALLTFGRVKGVKRPAIALTIPIPGGQFLLLDAGANADCKSEHLLQFAKMGSVYAERVLKVHSPTVGLLNIGTEEEKGNELVKEAHKLLKSSPLNFVGNVEGREIFLGRADVVVCDGFTGNVVLKVIEGAAMTIVSQMKMTVSGSIRSILGGWLMLPAFGELTRHTDYEEYGGAQLLGVNGVCIISHGSSRAKAIKNAIRVAIKTVRGNMVSEIEKGLEG
jgi:glycerol-3-phosphate acyltransferase PlsX